jgi:hypothetical protein
MPILLPLLVAVDPAPPAPPAPSDACFRAQTEQAVLPVTGPRAHILRGDGSATLQRPVLYMDGGCIRPVVVRYNVGAGAR